MARRCAIYVRGKKQSLKQELLLLEKYCISKSWTVTDRYIDFVFPNDAHSFSDRSKLFADAKQGLFDIIVFFSYEEFYREDKSNSMYHNLLKLKKYGVEFVSFSEPLLRSVGVYSDLLWGYIDIFFFQDRQKRSINTKLGQQKAVERGIAIGRPSLPQSARDKIVALRAKGLSYSQIQREVTYLNAHNKLIHPSRPTIGNILKNSTCKIIDTTKKSFPEPDFCKKTDESNVDVEIDNE